MTRMFQSHEFGCQIQDSELYGGYCFNKQSRLIVNVIGFCSNISISLALSAVFKAFHICRLMYFLQLPRKGDFGALDGRRGN